MSDTIDLKNHIRSIPDFPKPGILFYDISTLLAHPKAWHATIERPTRWPESNRAASCWRRRSRWRWAPAS